MEGVEFVLLISLPCQCLTTIQKSAHEARSVDLDLCAFCQLASGKNSFIQPNHGGNSYANTVVQMHIME